MYSFHCVHRLVSVLGEPEVSQELLCETVTVLGSFAHGELGTTPLLFSPITNFVLLWLF